MAKRVVQQLLGRTPHHAGLVAPARRTGGTSALFDRVAVTDAGQGGVRVRRRDPEALRSLGREGARVLWRLAREGRGAAEAWRAAAPPLTAADNWRRLFARRALRLTAGGGARRPVEGPAVRRRRVVGDQLVGAERRRAAVAGVEEVEQGERPRPAPAVADLGDG